MWQERYSPARADARIAPRQCLRDLDLRVGPSLTLGTGSVARTLPDGSSVRLCIGPANAA